MTTTIPPVDPYTGGVPIRKQRDNFATYTGQILTYISTLATSLNAAITAMNAVVGEVQGLRDDTDDIRIATAVIQFATEGIRDATEAIKAEAEDIRDSVAAFAGFKGPWGSLLPGNINIPASVHHNDAYWMLLENLPDVTAEEPGVSSKWAILLNTREISGMLNLSLISQGVI